MPAAATFTGACLCQAIEWRADGAPLSVHHCHCSMCRRWTGGPFATLAWFAQASVRWTGDEPAVFRSSPIALRSHCGRCGTPLSLTYDRRHDVALAAGTLDDPEAIQPTHHYGVESRLCWADIGPDLPGKPTRETW
jgi:hypothetical protein